MDVGVQVPPRAHMMTPTVTGWGFTLRRSPARQHAHIPFISTPALRSVASHPLPGGIRNLHHRLAGHNSIVISPHPGSRALAPKPQRSIGKGHINTRQVTCPSDQINPEIAKESLAQCIPNTCFSEECPTKNTCSQPCATR